MKVNLSFYDLETGVIRAHWSGSESHLEKNLPEGMGWIQGYHDPRCRRVEGGEVVDYQPPPPDSDHEWNPDRKRWQLKPHVADRMRRQADAQARLAALELSQQRPFRELALDPGNVEALKRLHAIEAEIEDLRASLVE